MLQKWQCMNIGGRGTSSITMIFCWYDGGGGGGGWFILKIFYIYSLFKLGRNHRGNLYFSV